MKPEFLRLAPEWGEGWRTLAVVCVGLVLSWNSAGAEVRQLSRAQLLDKIRGGWAGQMIGVSYGAPTEFQSNGHINDSAIRWSPAQVSNALDQDDLYVEMTFAKVMDDRGLEATSEQYGEAFKASLYELWHANAGARRVLNQGIKAPWSGHPQYNFHANDIDFQIEADFIGLMCPGLPRESNKYCDRVGRVMNYGDGLYGGMFVCGMYAAAFFERDPRRVVEAGLACIPAKSQYARLIRDLLEWSKAYPEDWRRVWRLVEEKWDRDDPCPDGALDAFNIDAKLNGGYIAFGLLFGGLDFQKTLEVATRCGQDSDCNPSSAGGVLGVMLGFDRIPESFKSGLAALADKKFSFTEYSFNQIVRSTETRALRVIEQAGGKVDERDVVIPYERPKAPRLEQWNPGIPVRKLDASNTAWVYRGSWESKDKTRISQDSGNEATLTFNGVAVAVIGALAQDGGRAEVYLDGKKVGIADAYIVERTHDNVLWNVYGLKTGDHSVRFVTVKEKDSRSTGNRVVIEGAVIYRRAN
jgi:hypothetical protein